MNAEVPDADAAKAGDLDADARWRGVRKRLAQRQQRTEIRPVGQVAERRFRVAREKGSPALVRIASETQLDPGRTIMVRQRIADEQKGLRGAKATKAIQKGFH